MSTKRKTLIATENLMAIASAMDAQNINIQKKKSQKQSLNGKRLTQEFGNYLSKGVKILTPLFIASE